MKKHIDSILSVGIGITLVLTIGMLTYVLVNKFQTRTGGITDEAEQTEGMGKTHIVKDNETLWTIAETYYMSGYNWVDIANANAIMNPDFIMVGQTLAIPDVEIRKPVEVGQIQASSTTAAKHETRTVVAGDTLWDIAVAEYGNGYRWSDIAAKNGITNPDIIYPAAILQLP